MHTNQSVCLNQPGHPEGYEQACLTPTVQRARRWNLVAVGYFAARALAIDDVSQSSQLNPRQRSAKQKANRRGDWDVLYVPVQEQKSPDPDD